MADEDERPYQWESLEPVEDGADAPTGAFIKSAGRARVTYPNGDIFEGVFNDALQKHGPGIYTWSTEEGANAWLPEGGLPDGPAVKYEGAWAEGQRCGVGKMSFPNGDRYHGLWENGRMHGEGTYYYSNGDLYSGNWVNGVKSGKGAFVFGRDSSQLVGDWVRGSIVSGKWLFDDGTTWHGNFRNNKPIGRGVFYFVNGMQQAGEYVEEGDPEDDEEEKKLVWRGGDMVQSTQAASDLARAPLEAVHA